MESMPRYSVEQNRDVHERKSTLAEILSTVRAILEVSGRVRTEVYFQTDIFDLQRAASLTSAAQNMEQQFSN